MEAIRLLYEKCPATISMPPEFRDRRVEVLILALDQSEERNPNSTNPAVDSNGWPLGFFEDTFGATPDFPERELQSP